MVAGKATTAYLLLKGTTALESVRHLALRRRSIVTMVMILKDAGKVIPVFRSQVRTVLMSAQLSAQRMRYTATMPLMKTFVQLDTIACLPGTHQEIAPASVLPTALVMRLHVKWALTLMGAIWGATALARQGSVILSAPCPAPMRRSHVTMVWTPMVVGWAICAYLV